MHPSPSSFASSSNLPEPRLLFPCRLTIQVDPRGVPDTDSLMRLEDNAAIAMELARANYEAALSRFQFGARTVEERTQATLAMSAAYGLPWTGIEDSETVIDVIARAPKPLQVSAHALQIR